MFQCGDYYFSLLYKPIIYEYCQAIIKNYSYIRSSNNLARKKRKKQKRVVKHEAKKKSNNVTNDNLENSA